jgi:hypothetical protein
MARADPGDPGDSVYDQVPVVGRHWFPYRDSGNPRPAIVHPGTRHDPAVDYDPIGGDRRFLSRTRD